MGLIFHTLDIEDASSVNNDIVRMPAHGPAQSIGKKLKSNGHPVNAIDWRANRLVDFLARLAACTDKVPEGATKLYRQVFGAAECFAASLGAVTFAANHYRTEVVNGEGKLVSVTRRDSEPGPRPVKGGTNAEGNACHTEGTAQNSPGKKVSQTNEPRTPARGIHSMSQARRVAEVQSEVRFNNWWRSNRATKVFVAPPAGDATRRLDALRLRLQTRT